MREALTLQYFPPVLDSVSMTPSRRFEIKSRWTLAMLLEVLTSQSCFPSPHTLDGGDVAPEKPWLYICRWTHVTVAEYLLRLCFYARSRIFLQCAHGCVLAHEINHYTLTEHIFTVTGGRGTMCTLTRPEEGQEVLKSCLFCHSVVTQDVWLAALLKPRRRTQRCLSVMQILSWRGQNWGWSSSHRYKHLLASNKIVGGINVGTYNSLKFILTKRQMIWLAFSEAYSLSIKLSSITWKKTYSVSPRWWLFWWPYDLSSRVTIYSEFYLDQHNVKMSCLWRVSLLFFGTCCPFFFHHHQSWG